MKRTDWIRRPYHLLLLTAIVLFIVSLFCGDDTLDIHLHDTYFVIAKFHLFRSGATFLSILWLMYLITFRLLSSYLTWMHLVATFLCIGLIITVSHWLPLFTGPNDMSALGPYPAPRPYIELSGAYSKQSVRLQAFVLFAIAGQLFFIANLLYAINKFATETPKQK